MPVRILIGGLIGLAAGGLLGHLLGSGGGARRPATTRYAIVILGVIVGAAIAAALGPRGDGATVADSPHLLIVSDEGQFRTQVLQAGKPVLVDFHATWCRACKALAPVISLLADESAGRAGVAKVDVDKAGDLARRYRISGIPAVLLLTDGKETKRWVGMQPAREYRAALDAALAKSNRASTVPDQERRTDGVLPGN